MSKISIYLNARASNGGSAKWKKDFTSHLFRHDLLFKSPDGISALEDELEKDISEDTECIFSVGGDGTVNTILQKIQGSDIKLMIVPAGTANDLAGELGISKNIDKIMKIYQHKTSKKVDTIKINGKYMITNGGIGLSADVAEKVNKYRKDHKVFNKIMKNVGASVYSSVLVKELLFGLKEYEIHVESPDYPRLDKIVKTPMIMVNNQSLVGGDFLIAPNTKNNDGKFNVTIFTHPNKLSLLNCIKKLSNGDFPTNDKHLIQFETDTLSLTHVGDEELAFLADGEILEKNKYFEISVQKEAIEVYSHDPDMLYCNSYSLDKIDLI
jgi:diacylglycerol kinase family enzyme